MAKGIPSRRQDCASGSGLCYIERFPEAAMTGREYAAVLREAAEFFDAHPYLPIPEGAPSLVLYYEHPSPAEIRWLTVIRSAWLGEERGNAPTVTRTPRLFLADHSRAADTLA